MTYTGRGSRRLQRFIIRTSAYPPFRWAYAAAYGAVLLWTLVRLKRTASVRRVEIKRPRGDFCFGSSDLDLQAQVAPLDFPAFIALSGRFADLLDSSGTALRIIDLYLLCDKELELKRFVESQSLTAHRIRLMGRKSREVTVKDHAKQASLGRMMYRFMNLSQEFFRSSLDPHHLRILGKQYLEIHDETDAAGNAETLFAPEVLPLARDFARGKRGSPDPLVDVVRVLEAAQDQVTALSATAEREDANGAADVRSLPVYGRCVKPDTLDRAIAGIPEEIDRFGLAGAGAVCSVILGGDPGCNYSFRLYVVLRDGTLPEQRTATYAKLRAVVESDHASEVWGYFRQRYPIVLTMAMWRSMHRLYHLERPAEEFYFLKRHGVVFRGEDLRHLLRIPSEDDSLRSAAIAVSDLRTNLGRAIRRARSAQLADSLLGRIPALWLMLSRGVVATSRGEALEGALDNDMPHAEVLAGLHERLHGSTLRDLPPASDSLWWPALDWAGEWIETLLTLALSRMETAALPGRSNATAN